VQFLSAGKIPAKKATDSPHYGLSVNDYA